MCPITFCVFRGVPVNCGPRGLKGEPDHLFHNNGDGTFTDVSEKAGVADAPGYYGLTSLFVDINNDGKMDLLVGDDSTPNYLYLNKGDGTFEDVSYASGYALNEGGRETATMGIAAGDFANDGKMDIFNTTFSDDYKPLYRNEGDANMTDISYQLGIAEIHGSLPRLGRRVRRLRQRWLERPDHVGWSCVSAGRPASVGHKLGAAAAAVPQRWRQEV